MSGSRRKPGPLGPFVEGYRAWLLGRGYSPSVAIRSLIALGHLGRWMEREALAVDQLTAAAVSAFLAEYRSARGRLPTASVWPLLEYLRAEGAVPPEPPAVVAPVERLVGEYREWLLGERGLAAVTVRGSEQLAHRFLAGRVSADDRAACGGSRPQRSTISWCASARGVSIGSAGCLHLSAAVAAALPVPARLHRARAGARGALGRGLARDDDPAVPDAPGDRPAAGLV